MNLLFLSMNSGNMDSAFVKGAFEVGFTYSSDLIFASFTRVQNFDLGFISCNCPVCGHMSCPNKLEKCVYVYAWVCWGMFRGNSFVNLIVVFSDLSGIVSISK